MKKNTIFLITALWELLRILLAYVLASEVLNSDSGLFIYHMSISLVIPAMIFMLWKNYEKNHSLIGPIKMAKVLQISAIIIMLVLDISELFNTGILLLLLSDCAVFIIISMPQHEGSGNLPEFSTSEIEED